MQTHLYLVTAQDPDGDLNLDLFVEATDAVQAKALWSDWLKAEFNDTFEAEPKPNVYQIPELTNTPRAIAWHDEKGVRAELVA